MRIMVPEDFLVISPQLAHLMVEWLWRERKNKKRSLFSATPCIVRLLWKLFDQANEIVFILL
jgi:hypothetical protein